MASVVIIEDDQRIRELMARVLSGKGHEVQGAATALDGLQHIVGRTARPTGGGIDITTSRPGGARIDVLFGERLSNRSPVSGR